MSETVQLVVVGTSKQPYQDRESLASYLRQYDIVYDYILDGTLSHGLGDPMTISTEAKLDTAFVDLLRGFLKDQDSRFKILAYSENRMIEISRKGNETRVEEKQLQI